MTKFRDLSLHEKLQQNLMVAGYENPTPVQARAIPLLLEGADLLGVAQTGTGKTATYSLPALQRLLGRPLKRTPAEPRVLILSPTRELCVQINSSLLKYAQNLDVRTCTVYGGVGQGEQVRALKQGVDIVVATPGRLLDLLGQKLLKLAKVEIFVLDEADRMLDMGFIEDIEKIISHLPEHRQTMLFSATMPPEISRLARTLLKNPERVEVTPESSTSERISQRVIFCKKEHKLQLLKKILKEESAGPSIVFTRTKLEADHVVDYLAQNSIAAKALHGDKDQNERDKALKLFGQGRVKVLVATDIASRGLDIFGVEHVINFNLPREPEDYVHRIGRTARAGKSGVAISFCDDSEKVYLERIQVQIQQYLRTESFVGKSEVHAFKGLGLKKVTKPTPGKSQEKTAYLDHSKRQRLDSEGKAIKTVHPGLRNKLKKRKR